MLPQLAATDTSVDALFASIEVAPLPPAGHFDAPTNPARVAFDPRLAWELALGTEPPVEVFKRYGYTEAEAAALSQSPLFQQATTRLQKEVQSEGMTFRQKARMLAEALLPHLYDDATKENIHAEDRLRILQWLAKVGDLEPKQATGPTGGGFVLNITLGGQQQTITAEPITIDGELV